MAILISVIIPCFNHGRFLDEALDDFKKEKLYQNFEIIIVNDGSTDNYTLEKLADLECKGFTVIHQQNQGLARARNAGILAASGKYILPLDSDNKIVPTVFKEAAILMDADEAIDVVYTDAEYFGEEGGWWKVGDFNGLRLLCGNYIDACALIRKSALLDSGLYDEFMPGMGNEDWELWVRFFLMNKKFYYLPKKGFYYRVVSNSMSVTSTRPSSKSNKSYIYQKHAEKISSLFWDITYDDLKMAKKIPQLLKRIEKNRFKEALKILLKRPLF